MGIVLLKQFCTLKLIPIQGDTPKSSFSGFSGSLNCIILTSGVKL